MGEFRHDRLKPVLQQQARRVPHGTAVAVPNRIAWEARAAAAGGKRASAFATGLDQKSPALTPSALLRRRVYVVMEIFSLIQRTEPSHIEALMPPA